jgi:hypothetical protein
VANLSDPFVSPGSSFTGLLNTHSTGGFTSLLQVIEDGFGNPSPLSLSNDALDINTTMGGGFSIDNVLLTASATQINLVCNSGDFSFLTTAFTLPSGTTAQRPGIPRNGEIRYNTTTSSTEMYSDDAWVTIGTNSPNFSSFTTALTLPTGTTGERPIPPTNGDVRYNTTIGSAEIYSSGSWDAINTGSGTVSSVDADSDTPNLVIVGGPITNSGTIHFSIPPDLTELTSIDVGNLRFSTNIISSTGNNNINLDPGGTGRILFFSSLSTDVNTDLTIAPNGTGNLIINSNTGIGTSAPENTLHVVGDVQFQGILAGWTGTGLVRSQSSLVIAGGDSGFIDFPIGSFDSTIFFINAKIAMTQPNDLGAGMYFANSTASAGYSNGTYFVIQYPPAASSSITFSGNTNPAFPKVSGTWTISGSNLRLTINNLDVVDPGNINYVVISSEYFSSFSTAA